MIGELVILGRDDPPAWPELAPLIRYHVTDGLRWAVLEGGMRSGAASVMLLVQISEGEWAAIETSLAEVEAVVGAARGAVRRWAE